MGQQLGLPNRATAAGIRQHFQSSWKTKHTREFDREALKGLTYICIDRGPFKHWLHKIGRAESQICGCNEGIQKAAHILECVLVTGGQKKIVQQAEEDLDFGTVVYRFLWVKHKVKFPFQCI